MRILKWRPRFQRVHQADESRARRELCAGDPIVNVDRSLVDRPVFLRRERARTLDLARDRLLIVGDPSLRSGFTGVDGGDHWGAFCTSETCANNVMDAA